MAGTKSLAKDSVIYGGSTILVRMISWLLTTLFTYTLSTSDYGVMTNLYAYIAVFMILLTFGMETGFFRFINQAGKYKVSQVYSTALTVVGIIVILFLAIFLSFLPSLRPYIWSPEIPDSYIRLIIIIMSMDAFISIPFAFLRYQKKPIRFGAIKILQVILYTVFCVFFLLVCPWIDKHNPQWISWFWDNDNRLYYVLFSNLLATGIQTLCLLPELLGLRYKFDQALARKMIRYSFPLVIMGLAGIANQVVDKLIFPRVYPDPDTAFDQLGIYSACFKIAVIMVMFTQAFRYAYDPFVFEKSKDSDAGESYAKVMKYFIILGLFIFLAVVFYLDIIKYFIAPEYFGGLGIIPIVLAGELFFAVYYNLSLWYKVTDKTHWGAIFSVIAFGLIIAINLLFIPKYSYWACAWAAFVGNLLIMLLSYFIGQKKYPIRYDLKSIALYVGLALSLYLVSQFVPIENLYLRLGFRTILFSIYILFMIKRDLPLKEIPVLKRFVK